MRILAVVVLCSGLLLGGCHGYGTPNQAVFPDDDPGHTLPPAINLPVSPGGAAAR